MPIPEAKKLRTQMRFDDLDLRITDWMHRRGLNLLRICIGIIFIWFGLLKVIGNSAAGELVANTIYWFSPSWFVPFLGIWEAVIGLLFLLNYPRAAILLLLPQMAGTFIPLILLPQVTWEGILVPTLEGQYIIKNLIIISAALVIGSHARDVKFDAYMVAKQGFGGPKDREW